ncbi:hypothetical protein SXCC_02446 [Gluconacetobacter sp. SXCC-1]|nr:hypothetical protein SXCC_02446 [Gluconacetobacter sp. SXCC-1]
MPHPVPENPLSAFVRSDVPRVLVLAILSGCALSCPWWGKGQAGHGAGRFTGRRAVPHHGHGHHGGAGRANWTAAGSSDRMVPVQSLNIGIDLHAARSARLRRFPRPRPLQSS